MVSIEKENEGECDYCPSSPNIIVCVVIFTIAWCAFYKISAKKFYDEGAEFGSRIVAFTHGLLTTVLSFISLAEGPHPFYDGTAYVNTYLQIRTVEISVGYFIYDLGWCLYHGSEPNIMIIHHCCSIVSLLVILLKGEFGAVAMMGLGTMEASNPFLQLRWFLRTSGYNNTVIHTTVEWTFIIVFLVMRLYLGTQMVYYVLRDDEVPWDIKLCTGSLFLVSSAFVFYLGQFVMKKYVSRWIRSRHRSATSIAFRVN